MAKMRDRTTLDKTLKVNSGGDTGFGGVFTEVPHTGSLALRNSSHVKVYHLNIENNAFSFDGLHRFLQKNIGRYVFSRAQIDQFYEDGDEESIGARAIELLRKSAKPTDKGAGGELGEILLYVFLEQVLNAPKLLSKVELKTATNMYVNGSDGIHLLNCANDEGLPICQLVFGESKIKGDLKAAVDDAFDSIRKIVQNPTNEIRLVESNIFKESYSHEQSEYIKRLIVPEKRGNRQLDKAFGIFLGYSIDIDANGYSNPAYRKAVTDKLAADITACVPDILSQIYKKQSDGSDLANFSFYFYTLPFNKADDDRRTIIERLVGGGGVGGD